MEIYRPSLHITPLKGWINDPNGFSFYNNQFHLFAQYNPNDVIWGPMYWCHFISDDLIKWKQLKPALSPDKPYDKEYGCFSGSAISHSKTHVLAYTGVNDGKQTQCIAFSNDGINYFKYKNNPVIDENILPIGYDIKNFRDPKIFYRNSSFYFLIGAKKLNGSSALLLFKTKDFMNVKFINSVYEMSDLGDGMLECCDILFLDGKSEKCILFCSPQFKKTADKYHYQNLHSTIAVIGKLNLNSGVFTPTSQEIELDMGFDFYATQSLKHNGNFYLVAWEAMWNRNYPSVCEGYCGQLIMPRKIEIKNDSIYQSFPYALNKYSYFEKTILQKTIEKTYEIKSAHPICRYRFYAECKSSFKILLYSNKFSGYELQINQNDGIITFNRSNSLERIVDNNGLEVNIRQIKLDEKSAPYHFDILIDHSSCEILINNGKYAFTSQYFSRKYFGITFVADSSPIFVKNLKINKYKIIR